MTDSRPGARVLPFPIQPRIVTRAARVAVRNLTLSELITAREAVRALEDMGAPEEEIDLVRGMAAVMRGRL
jgi:hypothetical protein